MMRDIDEFARVRPPAVAGLFYPADRCELQRQLDACCGTARPRALPGRVKALIAPHAGYPYSGATAGHAFRQLEPLRASIERVILLGPAHRVPLRGLAVPTVDAFSTPLGELRIDSAARTRILEAPEVIADDRPHAEEHCLEVELPFLQSILGRIRILPIVVGAIEPERLAAVLETVWGGPETLILVSSDLSHYHDYDTASVIDGRTAQAILARSSALTHEQACGATAINGLMVAARRHDLEVVELDRCNSGDTSGDRRRVVGYGAYALHRSH